MDSVRCAGVQGFAPGTRQCAEVHRSIWKSYVPLSFFQTADSPPCRNCIAHQRVYDASCSGYAIAPAVLTPPDRSLPNFVRRLKHYTTDSGARQRVYSRNRTMSFIFINFLFHSPILLPILSFNPSMSSQNFFSLPIAVLTFLTNFPALYFDFL